MSESSVRYACTLDADAARARLPQARALTSRLRSRERLDDRLLLRFDDDGDTATIVDQFVRDEQQCCPFFGFDVRLSEIRRLLDGDGGDDWQDLARQKRLELQEGIAELEAAAELIDAALACGCQDLETCERSGHRCLQDDT
jgi:hypothetical protein